MQGFGYDSVYDVCIKEERILITPDLDFANIIRYPSENTSGIVLVRSKAKITIKNIPPLCERLAQIVVGHETRGMLIIVEDTKIRTRKPDTRIF
jgi:hypothetical protein